MKYEVIVRDTTTDVEVISFNLLGKETERQSFWQRWKSHVIVGVLASFITGVTFFYFFPNKLNNLEVEVTNNRSTKVLLRNKKDEQERKGNSESPDGTSTPSN